VRDERKEKEALREKEVHRMISVVLFWVVVRSFSDFSAGGNAEQAQVQVGKRAKLFAPNRFVLVREI
jgi:hypothetical protein